MGLKNDTLLILDNCDHFLQSEKHNKMFKQALKDLHEASKYLRIITTSRMQFTIFDGFKSWQLNSLDSSSAIKLLQELNSMLTARDSREIGELVGNNPLALKIAAHLLRENNLLKPQEVISELKRNPMRILSPSTNVESEKILPILQLSYKYLNPITKTCAHYLTDFPGSFSTDAGINILNMSNFSDPESCIRGMFYRSLLEVYKQAGVPRCQFLTLIKRFFEHVQQDSHLDIYAQASEKFSWSYQVYYSQLLANDSQLYTENVDKFQSITTLENDIHNIQELFEMLRKEQLTEDSIVRVGHSLCSGLLSEVFPSIELLRHLKKVIFILLNKKFHILEGGGEHLFSKQLYVKLFSQAKLYLTAIDSAYCYIMCLDFDADKIFQRRKKLFPVNKELQRLLTELEEISVNYDHIWACGHDCKSITSVM